MFDNVCAYVSYTRESDTASFRRTKQEIWSALQVLAPVVAITSVASKHLLPSAVLASRHHCDPRS